MWTIASIPATRQHPYDTDSQCSTLGTNEDCTQESSEQKNTSAILTHTVTQQQKFPPSLKTFMYVLEPNIPVNLRYGFRKCRIVPQNIQKLSVIYSENWISLYMIHSEELQKLKTTVHKS
jgi:ArsR family metal-binding transcriptional regulator